MCSGSATGHQCGQAGTRKRKENKYWVRSFASVRCCLQRPASRGQGQKPRPFPDPESRSLNFSPRCRVAPFILTHATIHPNYEGRHSALASFTCAFLLLKLVSLYIHPYNMQSNGISPPAPRPPPPTTPHCSPYFPGPYSRSLLCAGPAKPKFSSLDPRPLSLRPSGTLPPPPVVQE